MDEETISDEEKSPLMNEMKQIIREEMSRELIRRNQHEQLVARLKTILARGRAPKEQVDDTEPTY